MCYSYHGALQLECDCRFVQSWLQSTLHSEAVRQSVLALDIFLHLCSITHLLKQQPHGETDRTAPQKHRHPCELQLCAPHGLDMKVFDQWTSDQDILLARPEIFTCPEIVDKIAALAFVCVCVCTTNHLCVCTTNHLCVCTTNHLCVCTTNHLCVCTTNHLCVCTTNHLCVCTTNHLCVCTTNHLCVCTTNHLCVCTTNRNCVVT